MRVIYLGAILVCAFACAQASYDRRWRNRETAPRIKYPSGYDVHDHQRATALHDPEWKYSRPIFHKAHKQHKPCRGPHVPVGEHFGENETGDFDNYERHERTENGPDVSHPRWPIHKPYPCSYAGGKFCKRGHSGYKPHSVDNYHHGGEHSRKDIPEERPEHEPAHPKGHVHGEGSSNEYTELVESGEFNPNLENVSTFGKKCISSPSIENIHITNSVVKIPLLGHQGLLLTTRGSVGPHGGEYRPFIKPYKHPKHY